MEVSVVLIDDNEVMLRQLSRSLEPVTRLKVDKEEITCVFHQLQPLRSHKDHTKVDLDATLKTALRQRPGVAVVDLRLEGDASDDYTGASLSLRIKEVLNDCSIVLVSSYFDEASPLLNNLEVFRYRVDRNQAGYWQELRERFMEAITCHAAAVAFRRLLATPTAQFTSRAVYLSYARDVQEEGDRGRGEIVNRIEKSLRTNGYHVKRDTANLAYASLISAYMDEMGRGGCIVTVISKKYCQSRFCMEELLNVHRNQRFHRRICPVVLPDADIFTLKGRLSYSVYWERSTEELCELYKKINPLHQSEENIRELHAYRNITQECGRLLAFIADMNQLTLETLEKNDFAILRRRIDECLSHQSRGSPMDTPHNESKGG